MAQEITATSKGFEMSLISLNKTLTAALALLLLSGCQQMQDNPKETIGSLLGAGAGALLGSQLGGGKGQLIATAVGGLGGAYLGKEIGKSLDNADRALLESNAQASLETSKVGATSSWSNPDTGNSGTFTPTRTYVSTENANCREYESKIYVDGREEIAVGTACRNPDGTWIINK